MGENMICCKECGNKFLKEDLQRSCSNCFVCTNCEIYICPECRSEIVVKEVQKKLKDQSIGKEK